MNNVQCRAEKVERAVRFTVDFKWASGIDFKSNFRLEMKHELKVTYQKPTTHIVIKNNTLF